MKQVLVALTILVVLSGCVRVVTAEDRMTDVAMRNAPAGTQAARVGEILNAERVKRGLNALSYNQALTAAAQAHAADMARRGYFSHTGPDGSTPSRRMKRQGYGACLSAENIAQGQRSAAEVMQTWMNSDGHRKNNLRRNVREYGVGHVAAGNYWVLVFASPGC